MIEFHDPPTITFTVRYMDAAGEVPLYRCGRCGALTVESDMKLHVNWHSAYSMERWDDVLWEPHDTEGDA